MNIREYIESGILEEYCLGVLTPQQQASVLQLCALFPEIRAELTAMETAMEGLATSKAITPNADLRQKILDSLGFPKPAIRLDLNNLPLTNAWSNHRSWIRSLEHLIPAKPANAFTSHLLRQDQQSTQMLIITSNNVPEEVHTDMKESFFILQGECQCTVGNNVFTLRPGDFLEIPLFQEHTIKLLSPWVVAIAQYRQVS